VEFENLTDGARRQVESLLIGLEKEPLFYET
jgi:hypothetical protein